MTRTGIILWNTLAGASLLLAILIFAAWVPLVLEGIPDGRYYLAALIASVGFLFVWAKRRWKFTLRSACAATPLIALSALLISSFGGGQYWEWSGRTDNLGLPGRRVVVCASGGGLKLIYNEAVYVPGGLAFVRYPFPQGVAFSYSCTSGESEYPLENETHYGGFRSAITLSNSSLTIPIPVLIILYGLLVWSIRRTSKRRRLRRAAQNLCVSCGYDLRASPGRCPECGMSVNSKM